jgi:polyisoprenoid-binding protein YceI
MKNLILYFLFAIPSLVFSEEWHVQKSDDNLVKFTSSTSLLDFDGITSNIDGYIYWDGDKIFGDKNEIYFEVDLNSVETGIGKRDRDMREDVLETDKYPKTWYKGKIVDVIEKSENSNQYKVVSKGKIFLHGIEKELSLNATINVKNNLMSVICNFSVFLEDHEIEAPSLLAFIKVAEEIKLHLNFELKKIEENKN